jgi:hypothetical protein
MVLFEPACKISRHSYAMIIRVLFGELFESFPKIIVDWIHFPFAHLTSPSGMLQLDGKRRKKVKNIYR